ncbi:MAG: hypothetical protein CR997_06945 [Acidobacteria bacterium]|nr:MAG: hypothetical protein CR997_06945 [Acidobacteriota bacterium]
MSGEKRKQPRYLVLCHGILSHNELKIPIQIQDINTRGASFVMAKSDIPLGQVVIECRLEKNKATFKGNCRTVNAFQSKKGKPFLRIGMQFTAASKNAAAFFSELSGQIKRNDQATIAAENPYRENPTEVLNKAKVAFPAENVGSGVHNKRKHRRVELKKPLILTYDEGQFKGQSIDFTELGIGYLTTTDTPSTNSLTLHCKAREDLVFQLRIEVKFNGEYQSGNRIFRRVGARIIDASPEYQTFLKENKIVTTKAESKAGSTSKILRPCRYRYLETLGTGGFAEVYLVEDVALHRKVAMKILLPHILKDRQMVDEFIVEAQISAKFHHPNIAIVYEVGEIHPDQFHSSIDFPQIILDQFKEGMVYFTMLYIEGRTLADVIKKQRKLPPLKVLHIMREVGKALSFAHQGGVIHRDIKPENIMLTFDNKILVTDFGIASVLKSNIADNRAHADELSQKKTKGFMGTPVYVSPEQILEKEVDGRSDLYSLGVTGYELLVGKPPFKGATWMETLAKHLHEPPTSMLELNPGIPSNFDVFIQKLLAKKKEDRPESAKVFLDDLHILESHLLTENVVVDRVKEITPEMFHAVESLFKQFVKTLKNIGTYPETHHMVIHAIERLYQFFEAYFEEYERLDLEISSMEVLFDKTSVFSEDQKENAFCFNLFRDGIRNLIFFRGLPLEELKTFLVAVHKYINNAKSYEMDSVTLLFQLELKYIDFEYSDSFYEDPNTMNRMYHMKKNMSVKEQWDVPSLMKSAFPGEELLTYWNNIQNAFDQSNTLNFVNRLIQPELTHIRTEAIRIAISMAEREKESEVFDQQYRMMEEVIYSCLSENDLTSAIYTIKTLESWALNAPKDDTKQFASRFVSLQERLSSEEFLEPLLDKYFLISRSFGDGVKAICRALQPAKAVPVLFQLFKRQNEGWKHNFIAECCVITAGPHIAKLNQLGLSLDDELAATMLKSYRYLHPRAPKTSIMQWFSHPGTKTRMALVSLVNVVNRPESIPILKKCALEKLSRHESSRKLAWQLLEKRSPKSLNSVVKQYFDLGALKELTVMEQKMVFQYAATHLVKEGGEAFLIEIIHDKTLLGTGGLDLEERKLAALQLKRIGTEASRQAIIRESKRILGNREFINYCKRLSEDMS